MPVMDGLTATRRIRELEERLQHRPARIIALTAAAEDDTARQCFAVGMNDILVKPFRRNDLHQLLHATPRAALRRGSEGQKPEP